MSQRDPKPEIMRLEELAILVKNGEIKLPKFQRPFVWKSPDMLMLLDSIYKGYPIGSLLLWNSSQRLKSERNIAGLTVDDDYTLYPTNYLLDGQQRLTTLCGALFWDGIDINSIWNIHFDLESEQFVHGKNVDMTFSFPLNKLIDTTEFIKQCMRFAPLEKNKLYTERSEKLLRAIKDYKVAVVKIGDMSIEEVAPIFERINSTGRKLTIVDLMMAATWSNGFDLSAEISNILQLVQNEDFNGLNESIILRSIAASADLGINKEDIQKLRNLDSNELKSASTLSTKATLSAVKFLSNYLKVKDSSFLPYSLFFTYLVEFFRIAPNPNERMLKEIQSWFWYTSVTLHFGGASTGDIARDLVLIREFASEIRTTLFSRDIIDITKLLFDRFNLKNASSTAFALILINNEPSNSITGQTFNIEDLREKNSKYFERLSPSEISNLNVSALIQPYKKIILSDIDEGVLHQHFLNSECLKYIKDNNSQGYVNSRADLISRRVEELTGCTTIFTFEDNTNQTFEDNEDQ